MHLSTRIPKRRRSRPTRSARAAITPPPQVVTAETADARRGGGPEDRALYTCMCGYVFTAEVSTTVACPHCKSEQAW